MFEEFASPRKTLKVEVTFGARKSIMHQPGYFYILTNTYNTVLYCGATDNLYKRVQEHKDKIYSNSFTLRYNIEKLVYFEVFSIAGDAFAREKQVKAGSRKKKIELIESINPHWKDLFDAISPDHISELLKIKKFFR